MTRHRLALLIVFTVSFGLLIDEIMLSAIFHVLLGAGNTVAAIAIALVGFAASGIFAYSIPALQEPERAAAIAERLLFAFALSLLASPYLIMAIPISHGDLIYYRSDLAVQLWRMAVYHITVVPFFLGGLTIAVVFRSDAARIGRLYFGDLVGAALGCLLSPLLLSGLGAPATVLAGAVPVAALSMWLAFRAGGRARAFAWMPAVLALIAVIDPALLSFSTLNTMGHVRDARYRSFAIGPGDIEYERWALDAWTIIRDERIPQQWEGFQGWGLSERYDGPIPEFKLVNYNARFSTYVTRLDGDPGRYDAWLDADLSSLHHLIGRPYRSVLNIGAGGGREVLAALHHGAERVVAVDVSEVVVEELMKGRLREFSGGLYLDPRVEAVADEGRTFAERSREQFDLVEFSIVGGTNLEKMDLVRVDDLFTLEALRTYLARLGDDGVFSYVMYSTRSDLVAELVGREYVADQPYIPALKTLSGLRLALEEAVPGARFADHVLIAGLPGLISPTYDLVHIVASRTPFSADERNRFTEQCRALGFSLFHPAPEGGAMPTNPYALLASAPNLGRLSAELPFSISPATDDRPFQHAMDPGHLRDAVTHGTLLALLAGNPLISMGLSIGGLAGLITLVPLLGSARRAASLRLLRSSFGLFAYFACIGFGYMAVEIAALLKLQSYLGKPIYGLSIGLFAFLLASGIGSSLTGRIRDERLRAAPSWIVGGIVASGLLFTLGSGALFSGTIAWSLPLRMLVAVAAIFPLALLMGMLFPIGIRLISQEDEDLIPWAWATNGCFSVIGIFGTRTLAVFIGFTRALLLGLLAYLVVIACIRVHAGGATRR